MDGPVGPAQPGAEPSVTQLVLLFFQDAVLAQPAGAPVAQPRGTVPRATKQLAQVRATSPSHSPCGRPCSELRWTRQGPLFQAKAYGPPDLEFLWGWGSGQMYLEFSGSQDISKHPDHPPTQDTCGGHSLGVRQALRVQTSN